MTMTPAAKQCLAELSALLVREPVETDRVILRPFKRTDLADLFAYQVQPEQQRLSGNHELHTIEEAAEVLDFFMDPSHPPYSFAIECKAENKVIGNLSIGIHSSIADEEALRNKRGVSLSYVLNENYWRQGIMTEILRVLYRLLFEKGNLDYINSGYFSFNEGSSRLQHKLSMKPLKEELIEWDGAQILVKEMVLLREDYFLTNTKSTHIIEQM